MVHLSERLKPYREKQKNENKNKQTNKKPGNTLS